ncbi:hypothetical protein [Candidatus Enterovibrio escicola]|uniref:hypothetical protein n=1 Tax=Candidatus Enterovibrio escicola TaxID=1927127 RepID=UPI001237A591|nr:hypothetical protein [Candidatus Enterovibrio escacola]
MVKTPNFFWCQKRKKSFRLSVSEVITIVIIFHSSGSRYFKTYYICFVCRYLTNEYRAMVKSGVQLPEKYPDN